LIGTYRAQLPNSWRGYRERKAQRMNVRVIFTGALMIVLALGFFFYMMETL
jgi:hypothetical protein